MYAEMNQLSITQREEVMTRDTKNLFSWVHSINLGEENPPYNHYLTLESVLSKSLFFPRSLSDEGIQTTRERKELRQTHTGG